MSRDKDLDDLPYTHGKVVFQGDPGRPEVTVYPEIVPGGANRAAMPGEPANWFSVDYESVRALAETAKEGDDRYGMENWQKGIPVSNLLNHAMDHLYKLMAGDDTEYHLEHAMWNLGKIRWMAVNRPEMVDVPAIRRYYGVGITEK